MASDDSASGDSASEDSTPEDSVSEASPQETSGPADAWPEDPSEEELTPPDPTPENVDEPEAELLPNDPAERLSPDPPEAPEMAGGDVDPDLKKQFWKLVLVFNVALLGMSLGLMFVGFEGRWTLGTLLFIVGAFAFGRGWLGYRNATDEFGSDDD